MIQPTYNILKSWEQNYNDGPAFEGLIPPLPKKKKWKLLGFKLISPLGVAAGHLPNLKWINLYAKLGFGSLEHKTVRTQFHPSHPAPNILYIDTKGKLNPNDNKPVIGQIRQNKPITKISIPFSSGQLLIVQVYGTNKEGMTLQDLANDYAKAALLAKSSGAKVIEINLSCPNVLGDEDPNIYASPTSASVITRTVKKAIGKTPLIIKVGYYGSFQKIIDVLKELGDSFEAVSAINTISKKVVDKKGNQALPGRDTSGVCGAAIKEFGLEMVKDFVKARRKLGMDFEIIGTGGVMKPKDVYKYLKAGANHVHCATAALWNPYIAYEFYKEDTKKTPRMVAG